MVILFKLAVFISISIALYHISRESLHSYRSHGFYRFFAWESVLALMLLNFDRRDFHPHTFHQITALLILALSAYVAIHGFRLLYADGKVDEDRDDPTLLGIEKTTVLVSKGVYRYIRHPLYSSFLMLAWGSFLLMPSWPGGWLAMFATVNVIAAAWAEEQENLLYFGDDYRRYRNRTKMFIPFIL